MRGTYHIMLGACIVAAILWFTVTMGEDYESTITIPLVVADLPESMALRSPLPSQLTVSLRGSGWRLLFMSLRKSLEYRITPSMLRNERYFVTGRHMQQAVRFPAGVVPLEAYPETLLFMYDTYLSKKVPLVADVSLHCAEGFGQVGPLRLTPDSIAIRGAESILRTINSWRTKHVDFRGVAGDISQRVELSDTLSSIVTRRQDHAEVYIPVQQLADVKFSGIPVVVTGAPDMKQILLSPSAIDIIVRGGIQHLTDMGPDRFTAVIEYAALEQDTSSAVIPQIQLPEGVILLHITPERIRFTIRQ